MNWVKGQPAIRQYLTISNTGTVPATLSHLTVSCEVLFPGPRHNLIAYGGYGEQPRETFFTGRVNDVAVLSEDAKTGFGFAVLSEVPGYMKRTELDDGWSSSFAAMYDTDLFPFERTLAPHETFTSAAAPFCCISAEQPRIRIGEFLLTFAIASRTITRRCRQNGFTTRGSRGIATSMLRW